MILVFSANSPVASLTFKILLIDETTVAVTTVEEISSPFITSPTLKLPEASFTTIELGNLIV